MKRLLYAFILLFGMFSVHGQSVWTGAENSDWTNAANWSAGVPTAGSVATIPANPVSPVFGGTPIINYTIQLAGTLTFNEFVYNAGSLIIFESGNVINNDQFVNAGGKILDVDGHFENNGTLDNFGTVDVAASGSLDNEKGSVFNNNNKTIAFGPVFNAGTINNNGDFNLIVSMDNQGRFNNAGMFESQFGSTIENSASATIRNQTGGSFSTNGIYNNLGRTFNDGDFIIQNASIFTNENIITNRSGAEMEVAGKLVNNATFNVNGPLMINSVGIIENNSELKNNAGIDIEICGNLIQLTSGNIAGSIQNNGSVYEIKGTINETNLEFGETFTDIDGRPAPVPACKKDAFLQLPESGTLTFTAADIEKGRSYGSCGAALVSTTVTPTTFTSADVGVQIVTITVTDEFGNSASCNDFVTVLPFTPPIVPVDDPDITFNCPEDITVTPEAGAQFAAASFTIGEATTNCNPTTTPPVTATLCPEVSNSISGFTFIGRRGGSKYFISHVAEDWATANSIAQANGGQLVTIDDAAENHYIRDNTNPARGSIWIGLRKIANNDPFTWESGISVNYLNWNSGEPNLNEDHVAARLVKSHGRWTDKLFGSHYQFVIEISCYDVHIAEYDYLGTKNGNLYYESDATANWTDAANAANAIGGNLVTIKNATENTYFKNIINSSTGSVWIGLTNNDNGNNFSWQSGSSASYTNWNPGEPNETQGNVAARLVKSHGRWNDRKVSSNHYKYLVEVPAPTCMATGSITREVWNNINGNSVSLIPVGTTPDLTEEITSFEGPTNTDNRYGSRVRGYIHPPVSGNYRFWLATDDNGELWLSTDDNPANKNRIAYVTSYTNSRQWNKFPEQRSAYIHLEAGQRYYIETLQKEGTGSDNLAVRWRLPDGTIQTPIPGSVLSGINNCNTGSGTGDPELTVTQIAGPQSGGNFPIGETPIIIEITDACGNQEICEFNVIVEENPAEFELTDCPDDINVNTLPGASTAVATFAAPGGTSTCFRGGPVSVVQNLGPESGETFPIGNTQITYAVFDSCGNFEGCTFNVNVVEVTAAISLNCTDDIILQGTNGNGEVTAAWTEPTASTDCFNNGLTVDQVSGPTNGSTLAAGTYPVIYVFTDACNNTEVCTFNVIVNICPDADGDGVCEADDCDDNDPNLPAAPGSACNDGNPNTENDVIGADGCSCAGTLIGTESDCDNVVITPGVGNITISGVTAPINSLQIFNSSWEHEFKCFADCDSPEQIVDGLADGTYYVKVAFYTSSYQLICEITGYYTVTSGEPCTVNGGDADGDGVCANVDCDDNDASFPAPVGSACNDGNPDTENDVIGANGCSCAGTPISTGCNLTYSLSPGNVTVNGLNGAINSVKILDIGNGWNDIVNCFDDCPTPASFDLPAGPYRIFITIRDANYNVICDLVETITITDGCTTGASCNDNDECTINDQFDADCNCMGTLVADNDNDGFCADEDCDDNDPSLPAAPGSSCDDGNADTTGDIYQADGCTCAGVLADGCNPTATPTENSLIIAGLSGPYNVIQIFNTANWSTVENCWGSCSDQVLTVEPGNYFVRLKVLDANYQTVCETEENVTVGGTGTFSIAPDTEFLHLFAREENRAVGLNWVNNSEYRNDYFVVERSLDGVSFTDLKTVDAYGFENREVTNYEEEDIRPYLGEGYYRVRQVFEDGTLRYSNVEQVRFDIDLTEVGLYPNPVETEVQLSLVDFAGRSAVVQIYNPLGVLMDAVNLTEIPERAIRFDVADYQAGLYTITVKVDQRKRFSKRFVKIKR